MKGCVMKGCVMKVGLLLFAAMCMDCKSSNTQLASSAKDSGDGASQNSAETSDGLPVVEDFVATVNDFDCNRNSEWTMVGIARYKNTLGHDAEMLSVARAPTGGTYPVGTIVQLNPVEAMVKRRSGFDATSNDWEFFALNVGDAGVGITDRGGGTIVSNARGTCLSCHIPAQAAFDLVCGDPVEGGPTTTHGCVPLPVDTSVLIARPDPKCM
jgi:hypothetical protein